MTLISAIIMDFSVAAANKARLACALQNNRGAPFFPAALLTTIIDQQCCSFVGRETSSPPPRSVLQDVNYPIPVPVPSQQQHHGQSASGRGSYSLAEEGSDQDHHSELSMLQTPLENWKCFHAPILNPAPLLHTLSPLSAQSPTHLSLRLSLPLVFSLASLCSSPCFSFWSFWRRVFVCVLIYACKYACIYMCV